MLSEVEEVRRKGILDENVEATTKEIVKMPEECGRLSFPISLKQPGPRDNLIQCFLKKKARKPHLRKVPFSQGARKTSLSELTEADSAKTRPLCLLVLSYSEHQKLEAKERFQLGWFDVCSYLVVDPPRPVVPPEGS
ncbi:hypothetical protein ACLOJK_008004 [Asimina triloba]